MTGLGGPVGFSWRSKLSYESFFAAHAFQLLADLWIGYQEQMLSTSLVAGKLQSGPTFSRIAFVLVVVSGYISRPCVRSVIISRTMI